MKLRNLILALSLNTALSGICLAQAATLPVNGLKTDTWATGVSDAWMPDQDDAAVADSLLLTTETDPSDLLIRVRGFGGGHGGGFGGHGGGFGGHGFGGFGGHGFGGFHGFGGHGFGGFNGHGVGGHGFGGRHGFGGHGFGGRHGFGGHGGHGFGGHGIGGHGGHGFGGHGLAGHGGHGFGHGPGGHGGHGLAWHDHGYRGAGWGWGGPGPCCGDIPDSFPLVFADVAFLPLVATAGIIGYADFGGYYLAADERPVFQQDVVLVLETYDDDTELAWTTSSGKRATIQATGTVDREFDAEVRRLPNVDPVPEYAVLGSNFTAEAETAIYSGYAPDKARLETVAKGDQVYVVGRVKSAENWLVVARNGAVVGYMPDAGLHKDDTTLTDAVTHADRKHPTDQGDTWKTDTVKVTTTCRSLTYSIDSEKGRHLETSNLAACKSADGGWVRTAAGETGEGGGDSGDNRPVKQR